MKLTKERVHHLAESIANNLHEKGFVEFTKTKQALADALEAWITDELSVEDRLNTEVRTLMKQYDAEIERGGGDYQKMFTMIKTKLVRERGLIL
ncbi:MAG: DUF507 family protein [Nitrospirales bacterium]